MRLTAVPLHHPARIIIAVLQSFMGSVYPPLNTVDPTFAEAEQVNASFPPSKSTPCGLFLIIRARKHLQGEKKNCLSDSRNIGGQVQV